MLAERERVTARGRGGGVDGGRGRVVTSRHGPKMSDGRASVREGWRGADRACNCIDGASEPSSKDTTSHQNLARRKLTVLSRALHQEREPECNG